MEKGRSGTRRGGHVMEGNARAPVLRRRVGNSKCARSRRRKSPLSVRGVLPSDRASADGAIRVRFLDGEQTSPFSGIARSIVSTGSV